MMNRLTLLCALLAACSSTKSAPTQPSAESPAKPDETEPPKAKSATFEVHEWGLVDVVAGVGIDAMAGRPSHITTPDGPVARKPVMYFHSDAEASVSVSVNLGAGQVQEVWPAVVRPLSKVIEFDEIKITPAVTSCPVGNVRALCREALAPDGYCERSELGIYTSPDASCISSRGTALPFLFYRSDYPESALALNVMQEGDSVTIARPKQTGLPTEMVRIERTREHVWMSSANAAGQLSKPTDDSGLSPAKAQFRKSLSQLGMTDGESRAFVAAWWQELFATPAPTSQIDEESFVLFWLSADEINKLSRVTFDPAPAAFKRAFLVRWHLKPPVERVHKPSRRR